LLRASLAAVLIWAGAVAGARESGRDEAVEHALAKADIAELQRRYVRAADRLVGADDPEPSAAVYRRVFTADARIVVTGQVSATGPEEWLAISRATQAGLRATQHMIGTQVVDVHALPDVDGTGGSATMTSAVQVSQMPEDGGVARLLGTYTSELVHAPGAGWKIDAMTLSISAFEPPR
jgi:hypothetical protein